MRSFSHQFVHAVHWTIAISAATLMLQIMIMAVLARLLAPAEFGLYAIANIAFIVAMHFSDRGLVSAIAREPLLDAEVVGSTLMLSCGVSAMFACVVFLVAPWVSGFSTSAEDTEKTRILMQLISARILVAGIGTPAQALMQRELRFRDLGLIQSAGIVIGSGAIAVVLASQGSGAKALFWGDVANTAIVTGACWWCVREQWSISWNLVHVRRIGWIGWQMTVLRVLDVLWTQLPLVVAKTYVGSTGVGLYQRSQTLVDLGIQYSTGRVNAVLFPAIAARQHRSTFLSDIIPPLVGLYSIFLFPAGVFVVVMAADIVRVSLGSAWVDAAEPLAWIMIAFVALHISQPASVQLEVRALFGPRIIGSACGALGIAICGVLLVRPYGLRGIAEAAVLSAATTTFINFIAAARYLGVKPSNLVSWIIPGAELALVLFAVLEIFSRYLVAQDWSPLVRLGLTAVIAAIVVVLGFRLLLGAEKRNALSVYVSSDIPHYVDLIAKLLGLRPVKRQAFEERAAQ